MADVNNNLVELSEILAKNEGIRNYTTEFDAGSMKGDNYMGILTTIDIKGVGDDGKDKELNVIAKSAITNEKLRKDIWVAEVYGREVFVYEEIFKAFAELQEARNISNPFDSFPKCYYTSMEPLKEVLVLDNLKKKGYKLFDRKLTMDREHVELVLKEYGRFHAMSFAMKRHQPETYESIKNKMPNFWQDGMERMNVIMEGHLKNLTEMYHDDQKTIDYVKAMFDGMLDFWKESMNQPRDTIAIVHGDCWTNNMLFNYEDPENSSKPTKMAFLDFQMTRVGNPCNDLAYFYYSCTSKDIYDQLDRNMKIYYDSFERHLQSFDIEADDVYSFETFKDDWKRYAPFGLFIGLMIIRIMLSDSTEAPDLTKTVEDGKDPFEAFNYKSSREDDYNERIKDLVSHLMENGF